MATTTRVTPGDDCSEQMKNTMIGKNLGRRLVSTIILMLKSYKSSLNLNSYKLDTRGYEQKIKELIEQNADLKSSLLQSKSKEGQLLQQLKNSKLEVHTLRNMMKSEYVVHENKCKNCAAYSKQSIDRLILDLDEQKAKGSEFRKMYQNELENKKQLTEYYEKKLNTVLRDKDLLVKKYEQKMKYITSHQLSSNMSLDSSTSIHNHLVSTPKTQKQLSIFPQKQQTERVVKKFPPPSPRMNSLVQNTAQSQKQVVAQAASKNGSNISALFESIGERLHKMQITLEQLRSIPQVQRFAQSSNPPKNKFIKLLRDFPFECEDDDLIEECYTFILEHLQVKRINYNGGNIIYFITQKMGNRL